MARIVKDEIERKFLIFVGNIPNLKHYQSVLIAQGYLGSGERLRRKSFQDGRHEYFLENKIGSGLVRPEETEEISQFEFDWSWPDTMFLRLEKRRYLIRLCGDMTGLSEKVVAELDVYLDDELADLIMAEVEFASVEASREFVVPKWFGREVTGMREYENRTLAGQGLPLITHLETGLNQLVRQIAIRLNQESGPLVVAVAGGSASGKTRAAEQLHEYFCEDSVLISLDDYYLGVDKMEVSNWDDPRALDLDLCAKHLAQLKSGKSILAPIYDFKVSKRVGYKNIKPKTLIIAEGIFALHEQFKAVSDIKVFVDANVHTRLVRKLVRDIVRTSQTMSELASYFFNKVEPAHQQNVQSAIATANFIINNDYHVAEDKKLVDGESQLKFLMTKGNLQGLKLVILETLDSIKQVDYYCTPRGSDDLDKASLLRLIIETRDEDKKNSLFSITYKGMSRVDSLTRNRAKIEVAQLDELLQEKIFNSYQKVLTIHKDRMVYQLDKVTIHLDYVSVEGVGAKIFIELVGEPKDIQEVATKLDLDIATAKKESYFELFTAVPE